MAKSKDAYILLEEERAKHEATKAELEQYRNCCEGWESAYNASSAIVTQLSAKLITENGRLNLTIRHLAPWSWISIPPASSCPALESEDNDYEEVKEDDTKGEGDQSDYPMVSTILRNPWLLLKPLRPQYLRACFSMLALPSKFRGRGLELPCARISQMHDSAQKRPVNLQA
ncbi:hypothetical protein X797_011884 [Metarhizium robertsii]|uniref:Uncharacterized protein n=1 Tax=Metarhizium robertsii TaxID=568076 RepID=A0A014QQS2_9HYPO|nr:hypothetical protein X797_011884 [Metarhizium robertsii]